MPVDGLLSRVENERVEDRKDAFLDASAEFLGAVAELKEALANRRALTASDLKTDAQRLEKAANDRKAAAAARLDDLESQAAIATKRLLRLSENHDRLRDRLELGRRLDSVLEYLADLKWVSRADQLIRRFPPLLKSLTDESKIASEQLLHSDFQRRFEEERIALRAPEVILEFPGRKGQAARKKLAASHKPSAVLSEGEQKVIALADFLAESSLRLTDAPIVFDDPVNSLDYRRIQEVTNRIALLARDRQIVVFTHNIWFAVELLARFEKDRSRCSYFSITDEDPRRAWWFLEVIRAGQRQHGSRRDQQAHPRRLQLRRCHAKPPSSRLPTAESETGARWWWRRICSQG